MKKIITIGEAMGMFVADDFGTLEEVNSYTRYTAGAEMNVAIGLTRLGFATSYVTQFGDDPLGRYVTASMDKEGINTEHVCYTKAANTGILTKQRVREGDPLVATYRKGSAATKLAKAQVTGIDFASYDHIHLAGVFMALSDNTREVSQYFVDQARAHNVRLTFDPNLRPGLWDSQDQMVSAINHLMVQCEVVLPGLSEGQILTGLQTEQAIAQYYLDKGVQAVIIKLGEAGAYVQTVGQPGTYVPGFVVTEVIDTVGAGDGFAVGVISALMDGLSMVQAAERGCAIGAIQVTELGDNDGLPDRDKLSTFMANTGRSQ